MKYIPKMYRTTSPKDFMDRVRAFNKKQERKLHRTFKSTAKKWRKYYDVESEHARFTLWKDAPPKKVVELQQFGTQVDFVDSWTDLPSLEGEE